MKKRLLLVPGHNTTKPGAKSPHFSLTELEANNTFIAMLIAMIGERDDLEVLTIDRNSYTALPGSCNALNPDVILEFHHNSATAPEAKGNEVLYWSTSTKGKELATIVNDILYKVLKVKDRGIKPISSTRELGGHLLFNTKAPCVIVEPAFFSNKEDTKNYILNIHTLAKEVAESLVNYLVGGNKKREVPVKDFVTEANTNESKDNLKDSLADNVLTPPVDKKENFKKGNNN